MPTDAKRAERCRCGAAERMAFHAEINSGWKDYHPFAPAPSTVTAALDRLEAVLAAMTPGPWEWHEDRWNGGYSGLFGPNGEDVVAPQHKNEADEGAAWFEEITPADRTGIVLMRDALPALLALARAATEFATTLDLDEQHPDLWPVLKRMDTALADVAALEVPDDRN